MMSTTLRKSIYQAGYKALFKNKKMQNIYHSKKKKKSHCAHHDILNQKSRNVCNEK